MSFTLQLQSWRFLETSPTSYDTSWDDWETSLSYAESDKVRNWMWKSAAEHASPVATCAAFTLLNWATLTLNLFLHEANCIFGKTMTLLCWLWIHYSVVKFWVFDVIGTSSYPRHAIWIGNIDYRATKGTSSKDVRRIAFTQRITKESSSAADEKTYSLTSEHAWGTHR